jgi:hypothetical protein
MKVVELEMEKAKNISKENPDSWGKSMLSRILTEMSNEGKTGCVYAEHPSENKGFYYTPEKQNLIIKRENARLIIPDQSIYVHQFINYIIRKVFYQESGWITAGLLAIQFSDEDKKRYFCVFARCSGRLGDFIKIDQF